MDEELELMYPDSDDAFAQMEVDCSSPSRSEAEVERLTEVLSQGDSRSCSPAVPSYPSPSPMEDRRPRSGQQVILPTSNPSPAPAPDLRFYYYTPQPVSGPAFSSQPLPRSSDTGTEDVPPDPPRASTSRQHVWGSVLANQDVPHAVDNPSIPVQDLDVEDPVVRFLHEVGLDGRDRRLADKLRKAGIFDDRRMQALGDLPESEFKSIRSKLRSDKVDYAAQLLICSGLKKRAGR
ncbi:hypothetical protein C8Q74DRAFT_493538 [Fomes fomentarius]|nr:hypothetical protein C8Q74DRAFT_493538 [Fomes fomentarius]